MGDGSSSVLASICKSAQRKNTSQEDGLTNILTGRKTHIKSALQEDKLTGI